MQDSINVKIEFKKEQLADLLCNALEGGSNYWCNVKEKVEPTHWKFFEDGKYLYYFPLNDQLEVV